MRTLVNCFWRVRYENLGKLFFLESQGGWTPLFLTNRGQAGRWTIVPEVYKVVPTWNSTVWLRNSPLLGRVSTLWTGRGRSRGKEWRTGPFFLMVGVKHTHGA